MGVVHRSMWSAEQWKLEPVNLAAQSSALCFHQLIFQFDFSLLAQCGAQADTPWLQRSHGLAHSHVKAVAAALTDEQSPLVLLTTLGCSSCLSVPWSEELGSLCICL